MPHESATICDRPGGVLMPSTCLHPANDILARSMQLFFLCVITAMLIGCGGSNERQVNSAIVSAMSAAIADGNEIRERSLAADSGRDPLPTASALTEAITTDDLFDWAEWQFPEHFQKGAVTERIVYLGVAYSVRSYRTGNYLGVTDTNRIYGLGPFTGQTLTSFGQTSEYADRVRADRCRVYAHVCVPNAAPVASAGPAQVVLVGTTVVLDGTGSTDANGDPITFAWALSSSPAGSLAKLSAVGSARPSFRPDSAGTYIATLVVSDGKVSSRPATVTVTASQAAINTAPVANAGAAQQVATGAPVALDGSGSSDANDDLLTFAWTLSSKPAGSLSNLTAAASARPMFTPDLGGVYVATLTVSDGKLTSSAATVTVTATTPVVNKAPVANAGAAQRVPIGTTVVLDGSASSDANGDPLTYAWTLSSKPIGSRALLSAIGSARPALTLDLAGTYIATLVVNDGKLSSNLASVMVTASNPPRVEVVVLDPDASANVFKAADEVLLRFRVLVDGAAAADGTGISLSTTSGSLRNAAPTTNGGVARTAVVGASTGLNTVTVRASIGGTSASASATFYLVPNPAPLEVLVPAYFFPLGNSALPWAALTQSARDFPGIRMTAILNPRNGDFDEFDAAHRAAASAFRQAGGSVIGYVYSTTNNRTVAQIKANVDAYISRFGTVPLSGFFIDEMTPGRFAFYREIYEYIKSKSPGLKVYGNGGVMPDRTYVLVADVLVTMEDYPAQVDVYDPRAANSWLYERVNTSNATLLHDVTGCAAMQSILSKVRTPRYNLGTLYLTDDLQSTNPWDSLPGYWTKLLQSVSALNANQPMPAC